MSYDTKYSFTAGEISPIMLGREDFSRFKNGCRTMLNMVSLTQGPTARRSGFQFIYSLNSLGLDLTNPLVRLIPFIFNEQQAYSLVFFMHTSGVVRVVFATDYGLVIYDDPAITECPSGTPVTPTPGDIVYLDMPADWDIEGFDYAQSGDVVYISQAGLPPHSINRYGHTCWTVEELTISNQPTDWSDTYGWPETVSFFQQRLCFGGNALQRQKVWGSQAGNFLDFGQVGVDLVDSDGLAFTMDSSSQNQIQWMQAVRKLNIGTLGNEWVVTGNGQTAITPSSILAQSPTNQGSERIKPLRVGPTTLFVEFHGRVVNEFVYDYAQDGEKATDLSILSPHLTEDYSISRWTYQQTPYSVIWCVREDGILLGLTYQRANDVVAWHRHTTQGEFIDVCAIPGPEREDALWAVIKRSVNSTDVYYLELKAPEARPKVAEDSRFLDSFLLYDGTATDTITGLDHLEGETVSILTNGYVHPDRVVSGGEIVLNASVTPVLVGLNYDSEVSPILPDTPLQDGSAINRPRKLLGIYVNLYASLGFDINYTYSDGESVTEEKSFRIPTDSVDSAVPLFTGVKQLDGYEGYDSNAVLTFKQSQPLPMTIISLTKSVEVTG